MGKAFSAYDLICVMAPWKSTVPANFSPTNRMLSDEVDGIYPILAHSFREIKSGHYPLWNPYVSSGMPLGTIIVYSVLYPINLLFLLLPLKQGLGYHAIIRLFLAGFFMYLFLRELKVGKFGSVVAAIVFMFNGFHIVWLGVTATFASVLIPLNFWLTEKFIKSRKIVFALFLSLGLAAMLLGGFLAVAGYAIYALVAYIIFRIAVVYFQTRSIKLVAYYVGIFSGAVIGGFLLSAVTILPFLENLKLHSYLGWRLKSGVAYTHFPKRNFINFLIPDFWGNPVYNFFWGWGNYNEVTGYVGVMPLLFAAIASVLSLKRKIVWFFLGLTLVTLAIMFGTPLLKLIAMLPIFSSSPSTRLLIISAFSLAVLAGIGTDAVIKVPGEGEKAQKVFVRALYLLAASFIIIVVAIGLVWGLGRFEDIGQAISSNPKLLDFEKKNLAFFLFWLVSALGLLILCLKKKISRKVFICLALTVIVADLFSFGMKLRPTIEAKRIFPETKSIRFLHSDKSYFRVLGVGGTFWPNASMVYEIYDIRAHDALRTRRYEEFLNRIDPTVTDRRHGTVLLFGQNTANFDSKLIDLMNVKYVLTDPDDFDPSVLNKKVKGKYQLVYSGKDMKVYRNRMRLPRAFVVHRVEVLRDKQRILDRLESKTFNPQRSCIIENNLPPGANLSTINVPEFRSQVRITKYEPNNIKLWVDMGDKGFLVLSDAFYPGWKVFVNGKSSKLYRANYIFRGVYLGQGRHLVSFVFQPSSFYRGLVISLSTLVFIICSILLCFFMSRRRALKKTVP